MRYCFHVGSSSGFRESLGDLGDKNEVSSADMIKGMMAYVWPKDDAMIRKRVMISMSLLVGSKVLNVAVPFLFKGAVDTLGVLNMNSAPETILAVSSSMLIGCECEFCF